VVVGSSQLSIASTLPTHTATTQPQISKRSLDVTPARQGDADSAGLVRLLWLTLLMLPPARRPGTLPRLLFKVMCATLKRLGDSTPWSESGNQ
jgi:hypothetical protein